MGIKRYFAKSDTTITNAFEPDLATRGTGSNMGAADILETFVIHGQTAAAINSTNAEEARILLKFPIADLMTDRNNGTVPSGSVSYVLKLYNAPHAETLPNNFTLDVVPISRNWNEGSGLDLDSYSDIGQANWNESANNIAWTTPGGDYHNTSTYSVNFDKGTEDIELDITTMVGDWIDNSKDNYGLMLRHTDASLSGSNGSLFTKRFFGRGTEFFFKRPALEARWDSSRKDNRSNFYTSSSLASEDDNINTLYLYNRIRGELKNIPSVGDGDIYLSVYAQTDASGNPSGNPEGIINKSPDASPLDTVVSGGLLFEHGNSVVGVYTASFACSSTASVLYDKWFKGSDDFYSGQFTPQNLAASGIDESITYITSLTNLKDSYTREETPRLRVFSRKKNWSPTIYTKATETISTAIIEDTYFRVSRIRDNHNAIPYGTGSAGSAKNHTRMSYDVSGSYFDLDMSMLEVGYAYGIRIAYYLQGTYKEQSEVFKFRVESVEE
jgi:hypothetical protein